MERFLITKEFKSINFKDFEHYYSIEQSIFFEKYVI